jgi:LCP family protein required for cell wall assembly
MGKDNVNSTFDFDNDPEFNENFYKNIEKALGDSIAKTDEPAKSNVVKAEEEAVNPVNAQNREVADDNSNTEENDTDEINSIMYRGEESAAASQLAEDVNEEEIDDELTDINASLAKQICAELDDLGTKAKVAEKQPWYRIKSGVVLALLCLVGFGFFFGFTKPGNQVLMSMGVNLGGEIWAAWTDNFDDGEDVVEDKDYLDEDDINSDAEEIDPNTIVWPDHPGTGRHEEGVYNILLMGEEAIGSGSARGRTDVIIIATLNTKNKTINLTSLMRDMLVQIPGYKDNKLNTAYEKGGLDLMYETISLNLNIQLDGCAMVNFENFEKIIDKLGGLEITLTAGEAKYLNTTNYISNRANRTVVEGKQMLNGNQVLGYSRVRKRATITGNNNDYGRTDRHRIILNAIFDKYKTESKVELAAIMWDLLPMIKTDIDSDCFTLLLNAFIEMRTTEMSQMRIPADGTFTDNVKVRGMDVLIPDLRENVEILHSFIFGDK